MSSLHPQNVDEITKSKTKLITFKEDLNRAIIGAFPTGRMPYNRVRVALVHWDLDDTKADKSVEEIRKTFEDYGFACRTFIIPAKSTTTTPEFFLRKILYQLGDAGETGDLTIFYYAGHSVWDQAAQILQFQSAPYFIAEKNNPFKKVARLDFTSQSRAQLDAGNAAVLYLLDTCYASGATVGGNREVFAAAGIELPTDSGWTTELCALLKNANGKPMTVAQLHGKMMQSFANGKLAVTPVHSELTPTMEGSIILAPFRGVATPYSEASEDTRGQPMVLISVQLEDMTKSPSVEEFKSWLTTHRPSMIHSVKIEVSGFHTSFSGLLLLTVPVSVWVCLRGDPAYTFVRFVTSSNLVHRPLTLTERPRNQGQGIENVRPGSSSASAYSTWKPLR